MDINWPPEFDSDYYARVRPYIKPVPALLRAEFDKYGKNSGAPDSSLCFRENMLAILRNLPGPKLEIGPGHAPDLIGPEVKYLDLADQAEIEARYKELPVRHGGTPHIDYLVGDLANGAITERFALVYSAHNFEHQVNCVAHLNCVANILNTGGLYVMAVPDKRFTFDYYRPLSTLVDILSAGEDQTRHALRAEITPDASAHNDSLRHWLGAHGECLSDNAQVIEKYRNLPEPGKWMSDHHVNVFDCDSFKEIFSALAAADLIGFDLLRVYNTPFVRNEFMAVFAKKA